MGGEPPLPLGLGQLQGAAQLVQRVPAHYGADEHAIRFKDLLDLKSGGQRFIIPLIPHISVDEIQNSVDSVINSVVKGEPAG